MWNAFLVEHVFNEIVGFLLPLDYPEGGDEFTRLLSLHDASGLVHYQPQLLTQGTLAGGGYWVNVSYMYVCKVDT